MRTFALSYQNKGPPTVNWLLFIMKPVLAIFTVVGPFIWCDNPQVRMWKIFYTNNNDFHHLGRSQMWAGACYYFGPSKPHSGTLWSHIWHLPKRLWQCSLHVDTFTVYCSSTFGDGVKCWNTAHEDEARLQCTAGSTTAQYWLSRESLNFAMMPPTASTDPGPARPLWSSPQKPTIRYRVSQVQNTCSYGFPLG